MTKSEDFLKNFYDKKGDYIGILFESFLKITATTDNVGCLKKILGPYMNDR